MCALYQFAGICEASAGLSRHRLEMYADLASETEKAAGIRRLVPLDALGKDME